MWGRPIDLPSAARASRIDSLDLEAELADPGHDLVSATFALGPEAGQALEQLRVGRVDEIAEHVQVGVRRRRWR